MKNQAAPSNGKHNAAESEALKYKRPRQGVWYADLTEDDRRDILGLSSRMGYKDALAYIREKYHKEISRASYYRAINRLNGNRAASALLKAAATPPALVCLKELTESVRSIDATLKAILAIQRRQREPQRTPSS